ncbi:hypothetical protein TARUN_2484 [Trichoderma arundinaceum]|uniref:Uncharacterized protein n=1 Tax=Trichoderma arundinaceum TaxID=490622 RepID=A0A395NUD9_TRIAR|nr:hypothetical protein TARUN_2484 [Trichoderma arundinaceum]
MSLDAVDKVAKNGTSMRGRSVQGAEPDAGLISCRKTTNQKTTISERLPSVIGNSCPRDSTPSPSALRATKNDHADPGVNKEYGIVSYYADGPMKTTPSSDADHIVIRAYKAIVNVINLRWSLTGLPSQVSLLTIAERGHLDNPGARLFALRSKLRNEQHMAIAIDRIAAVLLVDMRDDLGESYDGVREKGFRTAIVGNKMLADQWNKSHKEVIEEIRAAITYNFAEQIISPGINLLLGSRSQDVWEKRFSRKKVEALNKLLKQTEAGQIVLSRAKDLDDAVITIKRILSNHIGYQWRCAKYASINTSESSDSLFEKLQQQLSSRDIDMQQLENTLYSTLDNSNLNSRQTIEAPRESSDDLHFVSIPTPTSSVSTNKRGPSLLSDYNHSSKKCRYFIGDDQRSATSELEFDAVPMTNTLRTNDGLWLKNNPSTGRERCDNSAQSGMIASSPFDSTSKSPQDYQMLDIPEEASIQNSLENADECREDGMELHTNPASEYHGPEDSMTYNYGEQWGLTENVTTLDDILSLSW